jgi:type III secretion protein T
LDELIAQARVELLALSLASARLAAFFLVLPLLSRSLITGLVRNGVVASMALVLQPAVRAGIGEEAPPALELLAILGKEVMLGAGLGFAMGAAFWGVEGAGFFIDNQRGAAIAGSIDPLSGSDSAPLGIAFLQIFTAYVFVSGGFLTLLGLVYDTYAVWPVLTFWPRLPPETAPFFLAVADKVMRLTVLLAGPVFIAMFAAELALALVSRFAPQLNVFVLAMPVKSGVAFFLLILYLPFLMEYMATQWRENGATMEALRRLLE